MADWEGTSLGALEGSEGSEGSRGSSSSGDADKLSQHPIFLEESEDSEDSEDSRAHIDTPSQHAQSEKSDISGTPHKSSGSSDPSDLLDKP